MSTNIHHLTRAHTAIAAKKHARQAQVKEVVFDDDARREFLTGFHKRKLAKANAAREKAKLREKEERLEIRRDQRRHLREKALENAAHVEKAYGATTDADLENASDDEEWTGIQAPAEYEDEETLATVTVVEDFDPDTIIHGPVKAERDDEYPASSSTANQKSSSSSATAKTPSSTPKSSTKKSSKPRERKVRYETKDARRREQTKQHKRRTEKAELAGGKASRKPAGRGGRGGRGRGGKR